MNHDQDVECYPHPRLTATEAAVCDKVADGMTNREIAESLFVTVKAVEFHIHNSFLKLGVHNRTQLAIAHLRERASSSGGDDAQVPTDSA